MQNPCTFKYPIDYDPIHKTIPLFKISLYNHSNSYKNLNYKIFFTFQSYHNNRFYDILSHIITKDRFKNTLFQRRHAFAPFQT